MRLRCIYEVYPGANFLKYRTISIVFLCLVLRFANTLTYLYENSLWDCLRPRATRHELVDMSQTEGLTRLGLAFRPRVVRPRGSRQAHGRDAVLESDAVKFLRRDSV